MEYDEDYVPLIPVRHEKVPIWPILVSLLMLVCFTLLVLAVFIFTGCTSTATPSKPIYSQVYGDTTIQVSCDGPSVIIKSGQNASTLDLKACGMSQSSKDTKYGLITMLGGLIGAIIQALVD